jgi:hypothetical protein
MTARSERYQTHVPEIIAHPTRRRRHCVALANALTATALILYTTCRIVSIISPSFLIWVLQPWFPGIGLETSLAAVSTFQPADFVIGYFTLGGSVWLSSYGAARLYHFWAS